LPQANSTEIKSKMIPKSSKKIKLAMLATLTTLIRLLRESKLTNRIKKGNLPFVINQYRIIKIKRRVPDQFKDANGKKTENKNGDEKEVEAQQEDK
jgi:hypothetical protein